ncbi:hypothetical protein BJ875DRAFT_342912, partial [Amylocarpus encephaloides]
QRLAPPYELVFYPRVHNKIPEGFEGKSGNKQGRAPVLVDGDVAVSECGVITEYLTETCYPTQALGSKANPQLRGNIRTVIHAAEDTFMVHTLA